MSSSEGEAEYDIEFDLTNVQPYMFEPLASRLLKMKVTKMVLLPRVRLTKILTGLEMGYSS